MPTKLRDVERLAYSPGEAAKASGFSRATIYRLIRAGKLTARKLPHQGKGRGRTFIEAGELTRFMNSCAAIKPGQDRP